MSVWDLFCCALCSRVPASHDDKRHKEWMLLVRIMRLYFFMAGFNLLIQLGSFHVNHASRLAYKRVIRLPIDCLITRSLVRADRRVNAWARAQRKNLLVSEVCSVLLYVLEYWY